MYLFLSGNSLFGTAASETEYPLINYKVNPPNLSFSPLLKRYIPILLSNHDCKMIGLKYVKFFVYQEKMLHLKCGKNRNI